jgi:hypothetical protein
MQLVSNPEPAKCEFCGKSPAQSKDYVLMCDSCVCIYLYALHKNLGERRQAHVETYEERLAKGPKPKSPSLGWAPRWFRQMFGE